MKKIKYFILALALGQNFSLWAGESKMSSPQYSADQILQLWKDNHKGEALKQLDAWKSVDKKTAGPWVVAAHIAFEQKKYKRCLSFGEKALERSPQSAGAYYWRGRAFEALSNWMDAGNEYRAALLLDAQDNDTKEALSRVSSQLGTVDLISGSKAATEAKQP